MNTRLIERYAIKATVPYMVLTGLLLTGLLVAQQGTRFAEVLEGTSASPGVSVKLLWALLPGILMLTIPVAVLIGIMVGFGRLNANSELVVWRATGVSEAKLIGTMLLIALPATACSIYMGLFAAPQAARSVRALVLQVIEQKFESPLEPGTFETSVPGKILHVGDSDHERGEWKKVFIHEQNGANGVRLITARSGRIDKSSTSGEAAELVLRDAQVVTLPIKSGGTGAKATETANDAASTGKINDTEDEVVVERLAQLRVRLDVNLDRLRKAVETREMELEELSLNELYARGANAANAGERLNARIALHRRLALCFAPLCFALLGSALAVKFKRGGRGYGGLVALAIIFLYYLLTIGGEQLGRSGVLKPELAMWLATFCVVGLAGLRLAMSRAIPFVAFNFSKQSKHNGLQTHQASATDSGSLNLSHYFRLSRLLDSRILRLVGKNFCFCLLCLVSLFIVFTLFDVWRFVAGRGVSYRTVLLYFWYLQPFLLTALAPAAIFIAALVGYSRLTQNNEVVAWLAAGQSTYRLALPGVLLAATVGGGLWWMQENVLAQANIRQDDLRDRMKSGTSSRAVTGGQGTQWVADNAARRLFAYHAGENSIDDTTIYDFDSQGVHLSKISMTPQGSWIDESRLRLSQCSKYEINKGRAMLSTCDQLIIPATAEMFKQTLFKQSHLRTSQLNSMLTRSPQFKADGEKHRELKLAYLRRYTKAFEPLVLVILATALALACGRYGSLIALSVALVVGTLFFLALEGFALLGNYGLLPALAAAWTPIVLCGASGIYFLSRQKT
ncbi:MAG: LptF/LptG family permease [Pyrinomonadaceae bacterium MAG19_C2-C3]|nr:LptF/LptG family permease [Pyrinomonadaceae bacterium MAG19_C2-C3]